MAVNNKIQFVDYGLTQALQPIPPQPIVSPLTKFQTGRGPTTRDFAQICTIWVNASANAAYVLTSIVGNVANWSAIGGGSGSFTSIALPDTTAAFATGFISFGGVPFISDFGTNNNFIGKGAGNASLTGTGNVGVGPNAESALTTGTNNTGVGVNALLLATTGVSNVAIGGFAEDALTTGNANVGIGLNALGAVTTGSGNTGVGSAALFAVTTVSNLTAFGFSALSSNTTGTGNTAVGFNALTTLSTGNNSTAVGSSALASATVGTSNVAVGSGAMAIATTGSNCTAVGANTLTGQTTGTINTAIGSAALASVTTSSTNVALGSSAGTLLVTGAGDNLFLGHQAGAALLTGSSNVLIGFQTGSAYIGAESNNILVNSAGVAAESGVMRLGTTGVGAGLTGKTWVAGVRGVTTDVNDAVAVLIDSTGQMGTTSSSERYKDGIQDMSDYSSKLLDSRPVTFIYKSDKSRQRVPGLIAEEFAQLYPDMVVYDSEGRPDTIQYQELPAMLLNEIKKLNVRIAALESK